MAKRWPLATCPSSASTNRRWPEEFDGPLKAAHSPRTGGLIATAVRSTGITAAVEHFHRRIGPLKREPVRSRAGMLPGGQRTHMYT